MGTGKPRISTAVQLVGRGVQVELALGPVLAELVHGLAVAELLLVQVEVEPELVQAVAELLLVPVVAEQEHARVAVELEHDQAVAELEHALVAVERKHVLVVAPARGHPRVQLAVALRTKSVIAVRRHDPVPLLAAEDLAAVVAETTREPAAAEAVIAWEVADTVAVEAAVTGAAVVAVVAVAEDEDRQNTR
jgi:hypothetical protein